MDPTQYHLQPDGERFVDQQSEKSIPPQDTWVNLSVNQLIDVKSQLEEKAWTFRNNPQILTVLKQSVAKVTLLIAAAAKI